MENQITVKSDNPVEVTEKTIGDYLKGQGTRLPDRYMTQFINIAKAYGLNPFKREIYAVGYGDNYNIIVGYETYLKRSERTGKLDGWNSEIHGSCRIDQYGKLDPKSDMSCTITIYRKDWKMPFTHTVFINECIGTKKDNTVNSMWRKMPSFMLKKVAVSQGFRLAFPDEMGGLPYCEEELPEIERNATPEYVAPPKTENKIAPEPKKEPTEDELRLSDMLQNHSDVIAPKVKAMCNDALHGNGDVADMLTRLIAYLSAKGISA